MLNVQRDTGIFLFTMNVIEGYEIEEYFGIVTGCSIQGVHFFKDFTAYLSDKFGGRVRGYESSLNTATELALRDMAIKAAKLGANAVIGIDIDTNDVNNRMLMATCHGTAIRFKRKKKVNTGD